MVELTLDRTWLSGNIALVVGATTDHGRNRFRIGRLLIVIPILPMDFMRTYARADLKAVGSSISGSDRKGASSLKRFSQEINRTCRSLPQTRDIPYTVRSIGGGRRAAYGEAMSTSSLPRTEHDNLIRTAASQDDMPDHRPVCRDD